MSTTAAAMSASQSSGVIWANRPNSNRSVTVVAADSASPSAARSTLGNCIAKSFG